MEEVMGRKKGDLTNVFVAEQQKNKVAIIGYCIMNIILAGAYGIELIKGARTLGSYAIIILACVIPCMAIIITFFLKKDSKAIRYIECFGFSILYGYIMFTTTTNLAFCYILVIFTIVSVYADIKISLGLGALGLIVNIGVAIRNYTTGNLTAQRITETEILLACILLAILFSVLASSVNAKITKANFLKMREEKNQSEKLLKTILKVSDIIVQDVFSATCEMEQLEKSIGLTKSSMEDVAEGATETAIAIQTQQENTSEINLHIQKVEQVTETITSNIYSAEELLKSGQLIMNSLIEQVEISEESSNQVAEQMANLKANTDKMEDILAIINKVAAQTGLLALNASIEAARAGEAGKGFAVVASEISNLASQTSGATKDISSLIQNISKSLLDVVGTVETLLKGNKMQNGYVTDTAGNYKKIHESTDNIYKQSKELDNVVKRVSTANAIIVETIQNVSAITEEVTARATETLTGNGEDMERVRSVSKIVEHLNSNAKELNV